MDITAILESVAAKDSTGLIQVTDIVDQKLSSIRKLQREYLESATEEGMYCQELLNPNKDPAYWVSAQQYLHAAEVLNSVIALIKKHR